ncbi:hypothetical protein ACWEQL_19660 [Kitasatospora sp. NPDC004240]
MSKQGAPAEHRPEDGWWDTVYEGPSGTLPDTPDAVADAGSVDDWFDTAAGLIGQQRTGDEPPAPPEGAPPEEAPAAVADAELLERDSVDDWFDTAVGVIGQQRTAEPAPATAPEPAAEAATPKTPAPVPAPASASVEVPPSAEVPVRPPAADETHRFEAPDWAAWAAKGPAAGDVPGAEAEETEETEEAVPDERTIALQVPAQPAPVAAEPVEPVPEQPEPVEPTLDLAKPGPVPPRIPALSPRVQAAESFDPEPFRPERSPREVTQEQPVSFRDPAPSPRVQAAESFDPEPFRPERSPREVAQEQPVSFRDPAPSPRVQAAESFDPEPFRPERSPREAAGERAEALRAARTPLGAPDPAPAVPHVGERPPTYGSEPTALPAAEPDTLGGVVPDTVLEGAQYGPATLRAVSVRGDSARYRGEPRRDALLVTRFGEGADGLLLAVLASYRRTADDPGAPAVAAATAEACRQLAAAIGRSRAGLAADLRDGARDRLRYGLQRLATSAVAPLRALRSGPEEGPGAAEGPEPGEEAAALHCMLLSLDPAAGHRAAFGTGPGGLYLLRSGHWIDAYAARLLHHPDGPPPGAAGAAAESRPFRFRLVPATPGDILLLCTPGLAGPVADEPAVAHFLATHWAHPHPPGTVDFLRQVQVRAKGYADDRTAAALWTE